MQSISKSLKAVGRIILPKKAYINLACRYKFRKLKQRAQFYQYNQEKIKAVENLLADDYSKDTLNAYIEMFLTNDYTKLLSLSKPIEKQYFDESVFTLGSDETFVDMGVLDAMTSLQFAKIVDYQYDNILLFEPDPKSYELSLENIKNAALENVNIFPEGCSNHNESLFFENLGAGNSQISYKGKGTLVKMVSLDSRLAELDYIDNITYIKMDIEGAEYNALMGSIETIKKYKPKLAVCVYHKPEDIFELSMLIKSILPDCKLYIRHYNANNVDKNTPYYVARWHLFCKLVCYAVQ